MIGLDVTNFWQPYGLRRDPFFQEPLEVSPQAVFPVQTLFVGRQAELARIGRAIGGSDPSRTIVEGHAGVGKTSFVNALKAAVAASGLLVHGQPIRIDDGGTPNRFLSEVLRVLVRTHSLRRGKDSEFWKSAARLVEGGVRFSGGVTVAGTGVQVERERLAPEIGHGNLLDRVGEALHHLRKEFGQSILLHVNNLENLEIEPTDTAASLMQTVRDLFAYPGAHWLMVGATGIEEAVFRRTDQVSGFFPHAVVLAPLSVAEIRQVMDRRYEHLRIEGMDVVPPVEIDAVADLYDRYHGDLRNFLRLLSEASNLLLGIDGVQPLTELQILRTMNQEYRDRVIRQLSEDDYVYLQTLARKGGDRPEGFRVTEVKEWLNVSLAGASGIVDRVLGARMLVRVGRSGKSVYYQLTGAASVATDPVGAGQ
ncbi:MAG: AAA family ATPase [Longimicrobiales bacterium]